MNLKHAEIVQTDSVDSLDCFQYFWAYISEVTTLWRYTNMFIIIIIIIRFCFSFHFLPSDAMHPRY